MTHPFFRIASCVALVACTTEVPVPADLEDEVHAATAELDALFPLAPPPPALSACGPFDVAFDSTTSYSELSLAIALAPAGDTIYVCPGDHEGPFTRGTGWPLAVEGLTGSASDVVLRGPVGRGVFELAGDAPQLRLRHLELTSDGVGTGRENAFFAGNDMYLDVDNVVFDHVVASLIGPQSVRIRDSVFRNTVDDAPLELVGDGRITGRQVVVQVENTRFHDNQARRQAAVFVGLDDSAGTYVLLRDVVIEDNVGGAAAISSRGDYQWTRLERVTIRNNLTYDPTFPDAPGAALAMLPRGGHTGWNVMEVFDSDIVDNTAPAYPALDFVLFGLAGPPRPRVRIRNTRFHRNIATEVSPNPGNPNFSSFRFDRDYLYTFDQVDFGEGANNNSSPEWGSCPGFDLPSNLTVPLLDLSNYRGCP